MTTPPKIGFDVRPGNSGPGRYVASLAKGMEGAEWDVCFLENPTAETSDQPQPDLATKKPSVLRSMVPVGIRQSIGFYQQARRLARRIKFMQVDLFHAQNTGCEEMPVGARFARVPQILGTFHVDSTYDLNRERNGWAHRAMEWYSNRSLTRAIAVSNATRRDWIERTGLSAERVVTIHNGINPDHFSRQYARETAKKKLGLPADSLVIGGMGRLDAAKGFCYLIEAVARLSSDFPDVVLAIAGTGDLLGELEQLARKLDVSQKVHFLGFQENVGLFLDSLDVFVMASLCEALGYALLEAMAHGVPAIGTRIGGIPEVVAEGKTGFLCPAADANGLAAAIVPLLKSSELRKELGANARDRVVKHFHEDDMIRKTLAVYLETLGRS